MVEREVKGSSNTEKENQRLDAQVGQTGRDRGWKVPFGMGMGFGLTTRYGNGVGAHLGWAGNLSLVPKAEIINFTSKLLSDSQVKLYRNSLKMPALILDKKEIMISRFISSNGLVEDPCAIEKERVMINCWSTEEKEIFMDKLATFGKDFAKIASFLDHKTTADCVEFYYRNHKSDWFVKIKKKPEFANQVKFSSTNNYLVTSAKRWTREMNAASLDMLGAVIVANAADVRQNQQKCKKRFPMGVTTGYRARRGDVGIARRSASLERERETVAADVLAGICGSLSSEAMSSSTRWHLTPEVAQNVDDEACSDERSREINPTDWTDEEKSIFIQAVSSYGKDFTMISRCMRTRSRDECKVFFSKARKCLGLDEIHPRPGNEDMPASDNVNGGGGDNEDGCVVETGSVICSESEISGSKIDEDTMQSHLNMNRIESDPVENNGTGGSFSKDPDLQSENMVTEDRADGNLEAHFGGDSKMENGIDSLTVTVRTHEDAVLPSDTATGGNEANIEGNSFAKPLLAEESNHHGQTVSGAEGEIVAVGPELLGKQLTSENNLNDEQEENVDAGKSVSDLNSVDELHTNRNTYNLAAVANTLEEFGGDPKQEQSISLELNPHAGLHVISAEQNVPLVNANFVTSSSQHEKTLGPDTPSTLDWENINDNPCQKSSSADYHYPDRSGHNVFGHASSCQILRGYPLRFLTKKEVNGDISYEKLASLQSPSKECFLRKCSSSQTESSVAELLFPTQEQKSDHSRPPSRSLSDTQKPCRMRDLKLFGKILTYPTSQQNQNTTVDHENEDKGIEVQNLKLSSRSFNLEFNGTHCVDGNLIPAKLDRVDYLGLENVPLRSYGFWDGTRIRTGFSSLPDSAILLAKYPAAFGNYPTTSNMDQKFECNLNGVSVFSSREKPVSNGVADYQFYRNREGCKLQPFTVDLKQQQEMNGFEAVSSIQQQAKGMVGINVVGRGGILVGGACTAGVSDPVTAIKMHYAKAEQYGGGQATREEEN